MAPMFLCIIWVITVNMDLILIEIVENCGIPTKNPESGYFLVDFWKILNFNQLGIPQNLRFFNNMNQIIPGGHKSGVMTQKWDTYWYVFYTPNRKLFNFNL